MIQIENLSFGYRKKTLLFEGLNLSLNKGHIYGLLGKNGAGKSTLLKNMTGLAFPQKGSCLYNGINVSNRTVSVLEDIYFIAEELYVPSLTPVQFVANTAGFYPKFSQSDFYHYLKLLDVDMDGKMDKQSFGQQKKAMIAFGLATNTNLLIMDEPTNGLDIPSKVQFRKLIASVLTDDRCMVISTHQVRDLDSLIDTLLVLNDREIVVNLPMDEVVDKLIFGLYPDTGGLPVVYEEESIRGKNAILRNMTGNFSKVDLELLFNGIITGNKTLLEILKASPNE
ncbi:ABC transporter ATP-binding protein [Mucilaginibacter gotjawali]|uniref:ABC-2 type transport system ATP-binding protein n=2 Tax=Mucilaginibacter gotjawali TaxID=1550579 RepID=A0A839S8D2_9SPHI|nr:ABC transporter ATP-binding protein [Mucilaginibacter gotjawali]MBB3054056.1 ABC-2 type transport system ATP-binding protein [Mucilaginibacter gotjawali]BAU54325.1 SkfA peptide export ATP-binding protein SkfE [Mucilaginibacter gotjawali]